MDIPIKRFDPDYPLPAQSESGAACFDLFCRETVTIPPRQLKAVRQNFALKVPEGYALLLFSRSSTPIKKGLMLANGVGVVDAFYHGDDDEVMTFFLNITDDPVTVEAGERIAQGMIMKTEPVTWREVESMESDGHGGYRYLDHIK
jgi:dUTP pyrophosphatase